MGKIIDESFVFTFRDKKNRKLLYAANYHSSKKLNVSIAKDLSDNKPIQIDKKLKDKDGWNTFYNNATFEDILKDIKPPQPKWNNLDKLEASNLKEFLEQIRDEPYYLTNPQVLVNFENILTEVKYNRNQNTRRKLRDALIQYFVPKFKTSEKPTPPIKLPLELLRKLAKYLSKKCINELENQDYEKKDCISKNGKDYTIELNCYKKIMRWASKNEPRICRVKPTGIKAMIESEKQRKNTTNKDLIIKFNKTVDLSDNHTLPEDLKPIFKSEFKKYVSTIKIIKPTRDLLDGYALNEKELSLLITSPSKYASKKLSSHLNISLATTNRLLK